MDSLTSDWKARGARVRIRRSTIMSDGAKGLSSPSKSTDLESETWNVKFKHLIPQVLCLVSLTTDTVSQTRPMLAKSQFVLSS